MAFLLAAPELAAAAPEALAAAEAAGPEALAAAEGAAARAAGFARAHAAGIANALAGAGSAAYNHKKPPPAVLDPAGGYLAVRGGCAGGGTRVAWLVAAAVALAAAFCLWGPVAAAGLALAGGLAAGLALGGASHRTEFAPAFRWRSSPGRPET